MIVECPNCVKETHIDEHVQHCECGRIFVEYLDTYSDEKMKRKSHHRRTGIDVDQVDG